MKKKDDYFLKLHKRLLKTGELRAMGVISIGLCNVLTNNLFYHNNEDAIDFFSKADSPYLKTFGLFIPTSEEKYKMMADGMDASYWGSGMPIFQDHIMNQPPVYGREFLELKMHGYTPLRQTIILLCHEILNS